ncbi:MAG: hypothetical protein DRG37_03980 [Deltaproteobacteria bacterium]|nr:MAG: hypothetical protein DRG37_03980 [Deltaproteobacteria bacterium]
MDISRRGFLKLTGGTLAVTGLGAGIINMKGYEDEQVECR